MKTKNKRSKFRFTLKQIKLLELYFKALANKKRVKILLLINKRPGINVGDIARILTIGYQTAAVHTQRLERVGLTYKKYHNTEVQHTLTDKGRRFLKIFGQLLK
jgi:DNA-binding transcriptional ArsR family regulator